MTHKIWLVAWCALAALVLSPHQATAADPGASPADMQRLLTIGKDERLLGNPNAPITIIEYASMTCPHCAHFADDVLPELKKKWIDTGKMKLVLRDFPLDDEAVHASMIARCAPARSRTATIIPAARRTAGPSASSGSAMSDGVSPNLPGFCSR